MFIEDRAGHVAPIYADRFTAIEQLLLPARGEEKRQFERDASVGDGGEACDSLP